MTLVPFFPLVWGSIRLTPIILSSGIHSLKFYYYIFALIVLITSHYHISYGYFACHRQSTHWGLLVLHQYKPELYRLPCWVKIFVPVQPLGQVRPVIHFCCVSMCCCCQARLLHTYYQCWRDCCTDQHTAPLHVC